MTFGEMLADKRISQSECARELGISRQLVNMLVKGTREPGAELKAKIEKVYGYVFLKKNRVVFDHKEIIKVLGGKYEGKMEKIWERGVKDACEFYGGK